MPPKPSIHRISALLDDISADLQNTDFSQPLMPQGLRVELLPIQMVRPDPAQPRRVLPESIYTAFCETRLTPVQALREFMQLVNVIARQKGRPFTNILDLLPNTHEDAVETDDPKFTPEETLLRELVTLAVTIRDDGQVNPLTVIDKSEGVTQLFKIETGERRYWATWLMIEFLPSYQGDGTLPCIIVPNQTASVFRQAKENTSRSGLNAIAMARQAALLILHVHGIEPPDDGPVSNDFYRQALDLHLRGKQAYTPDILAAMGGMSRAYFSRIKALIGLADDALELADRHHLDEGRLRYVLTLPFEHQHEMVRQIVEFNLTMKQVKEICEAEENEVVEEKYPKETLQMAKSILSKTLPNLQQTAHFLVEREGDMHLARAKVQRHKQFLEELERYLSQ